MQLSCLLGADTWTDRQPSFQEDEDLCKIRILWESPGHRIIGSQGLEVETTSLTIFPRDSFGYFVFSDLTTLVCLILGVLVSKRKSFPSQDMEL